MKGAGLAKAVPQSAASMRTKEGVSHTKLQAKATGIDLAAPPEDHVIPYFALLLVHEDLVLFRSFAPAAATRRPSYSCQRFSPSF